MSNRPYVWTGGEETDKYDAIIDCPHYVSQRRPHMSMIDRAAQFSPFDALEGYSDEIDETARTTDDRIELSEMQMDELNGKINRLNEICAEAAHRAFDPAIGETREGVRGPGMRKSGDLLSMEACPGSRVLEPAGGIELRKYGRGGLMTAAAFAFPFGEGGPRSGG